MHLGWHSSFIILKRELIKVNLQSLCQELIRKLVTSKSNWQYLVISLKAKETNQGRKHYLYKSQLSLTVDWFPIVIVVTLVVS